MSSQHLSCNITYWIVKKCWMIIQICFEWYDIYFVMHIWFPIHANGIYICDDIIIIILVCSLDTNGISYLTTNGYISGQIRYFRCYALWQCFTLFMISKLSTLSNGLHFHILHDFQKKTIMQRDMKPLEFFQGTTIHFSFSSCWKEIDNIDLLFWWKNFW